MILKTIVPALQKILKNKYIMIPLITLSIVSTALFDKDIYRVKNLVLDFDTTITLQEALERNSFFKNSHWEHETQGPDEQGVGRHNSVNFCAEIFVDDIYDSLGRNPFYERTHFDKPIEFKITFYICEDETIAIADVVVYRFPFTHAYFPSSTQKEQEHLEALYRQGIHKDALAYFSEAMDSVYIIPEGLE